jgi:hypothetical protein
MAIILAALVAGAGLIGLYALYRQSSDVAPDSIAGYAFAGSGTLLLLLTGAGYALRKRAGRYWPGRLNTILAWHVVTGLLGLMLILMHAAGNFNPRSGTYALYGLIGVVASGIVGRILDRVCPRLAAGAALQAWTIDRAVHRGGLAEELGIADNGGHTHLRLLCQPYARGVPWDLAYYDLDPAIEDIPVLFIGGSGERVAPARDQRAGATRSFNRPRAPGEVMQPAAALAATIGRERFFLELIRVWRRLHILISLVALCLLLWHLEYAATLLL